MRRKLSFVFLGTAAVAGAAAVAAFAQHANHGHWQMHGDGTGPCQMIAQLHQSQFEQFAKLHEELNLSDAQKETVHETLKAHHGELAVAVKPVVIAKLALCDAVFAENVDEAAIRAAADALGKALGSAAVTVAGIKTEVHHKVDLTPEQLQKIADFKAQHSAMLEAFLNSLPSEPEGSN